MKMMFINGSPRKNWNTDLLMNEAMKGALSRDAAVELVHLYDLTYRGCRSCFACKRKGALLAQCIMKDDLYPVLEKIHKSDAFVIGSPIYFNCVTGETRSCLERLFFPYISYDGQPSSFGRKTRTAFIYTMNVPAAYLEVSGYNRLFEDNRKTLENIFGSSEYLISTETLQFDDYSRYAASMIDRRQRVLRRQTVFKEDLQKAFELGARLAAN
jgi:multimeric flavodoxin WrbA